MDGAEAPALAVDCGHLLSRIARTIIFILITRRRGHTLVTRIAQVGKDSQERLVDRDSPDRDPGATGVLEGGGAAGQATA